MKDKLINLISFCLALSFIFLQFIFLNSLFPKADVKNILFISIITNFTIKFIIDMKTK